MKASTSSALVFLLFTQVIHPLTALAQSRPGSASPGNSSSSGVTPINLDLSSKNRNLTANNLGSSGQVSIKVGNQTMQVNAATMLTPAERLAVYQVLSTGQQSILLGSLGNAIGGSFNIGAKFNQYVSSLVIPRGVTAIQNAAVNSNLSLAGNLTNAGSLLGVSTSQDYSSLLISAQNIYNRQGALISTMLPAGGIAGVSGAISSLNLSLSALNNIVNYGSIISSGNLNLSAGNSIINALPAGTSGAAPLMQAAGNLSFNSSQIANAGLINAINGNVNFATQGLQSLNINNKNGTIQALLGSINLRDAFFSGKADTSLLGGNLLSKELNVFSSDGIANVHVKDLTGVVNVSAACAFITAETDNLSIGSLNLTGDPLIANAAGDLTLLSSMNLITNGADLALLAKGNITAGNALSIDTSSLTGSGGDITIVAGANFAAPVGNVTKVTGASSTGGSINFLSPSSVSLIDSSAKGASGDAGSIQLLAFAGSTKGSGTITLPSSMPINANSVGGKAGDVIITAGGQSAVVLDNTSPATAKASTVQVSISGGVTTVGALSAVNFIGPIHNVGLAGTGSTSIIAAQPKVSTGGVTITDGSITAGSFSAGTPTASNGRIYLGAIDSSKDLTVSSGNTIVFSEAVNVGGNATVSTTANNGNISIEKNFKAGGNISLTAHGSGSITTQSFFIASPQVGSGAYGAAIQSLGNFVYVPNNASNTVSVIDSSTNLVVATIDLSAVDIVAPRGAASSANGQFIYVVGNSSTAGQGTVVVIDTSNNTVSTTYSFQSGTPSANANFEPKFVGVSGGKVYVLSDYALGTSTPTAASQLTVIDPLNPGSPVNVSLPGAVGRGNFGGLAINPQGTRAYIANTASNNISVVDLSNNTVTSTISLGTAGTTGPTALSFNPTGSRLFVAYADTAGSGSMSLKAIDTLPGSNTFNQVVLTQPFANANPAAIPLAISSTPTGAQLIMSDTNLVGIQNPISLSNTEVPFFPSGINSVSGYGTSNFSTIVTNGGVRNVQSYITTPDNTGKGNVLVLQAPTIQSGKDLTLKSTSGVISVSYDVQGNTLIANTSSSVTLSNVGTAASNIGPSSSGSNGLLFQVNALGGLATIGAITGGAIALTSVQGGITLGANVGTATTSAISLEAADSITSTAGKVIAKSIDLTSHAGSIGTDASHRITTSTGTMNIYRTGTGNVFVGNTGTLLVPSVGNGTGTFDITNGGNITVLNAIAGTNVSVVTTSSNGKISLAGVNTPDASSSTSINLNANGTGSITTTAPLNALLGSITLKSGTGNIGTSTLPLSLNTAQLSANTTGAGSVFLTNTSDLKLGNSGAGKTFQLVNAGSIGTDSNPTGSIAGSVINLTDTKASTTIVFGGNVGSSTSTVTIDASPNTVSVSQKSGILSAASLKVTTTSGDINLNNVRASKMTFDSTSGDVTIVNNVTSSLLGAKGDVINISNPNAALTIAGSVLGSDITLSSTNSTATSPGKIIISADIGNALTDGIHINTTKSGTITQTKNTFSITSNSAATGIFLQTEDGAIGTSAIPINTVTEKLAANTTGVFGSSVFINNTGADLVLGKSSGQSFTLKNTGNISQNIPDPNNPPTVLYATFVDLTSTTGSIGVDESHRFNIAGTTANVPSALELTINTGGNAFISGNNSNGASVQINLAKSSFVAGSSGASIWTFGGSLLLTTGATLKSNGTIDFSSSGDIIQLGTATQLFAPKFIIESSTNTGSSKFPLLISALPGSNIPVEISVHSFQDMHISSKSSLTVVNTPLLIYTPPVGPVVDNNNKVDGSLFLTSSGAISFANGVYPNGGALVYKALGGSINVGSSVNFTTTSTSLTASAGSVNIGTGSLISTTGLVISARDAITQADAAAKVTISAGTISLTSGTQGIGTALNPIAFQAGLNSLDLTVVSKGSAFLEAPTAGKGEELNLVGNSSATGTFSLKSVNDVRLQDNASKVPIITGGAVVIETTGTAKGIIQNVLGATSGVGISSPTITLKTAKDGIVGDSKALVLASSKGTVTLNVVADKTVSISSKNNVILQGALNLTSATSTGVDMLVTGNLLFDTAASITSKAHVDLTATGSITQKSTGGSTSVTSDAITLTSGTAGIGTASARFGIDTNSTGNIEAISKGDVFLSANNATQTIFAGDSEGRNFDVSSIGTISISAGDSIYGTSSIAINVTGAGNGIFQTGVDNPFISNKITLNAPNAVSGTDGVGTAANAIGITSLTANGTITLSTSSKGSINIVSDSAVNLGAVSADVDSNVGITGFKLNSDGKINVTNVVTAGNVFIAGTKVGANITSSGKGSVNGVNVTLETDKANIGSSTAGLVTGAANLFANTSSSGLINLKSTNLAGVNLGASSSSTSLTLTAVGPLTVSGAISTNAPNGSKAGNLSLVTNSGKLQVSANLSASEGSIKIQNTDKNGSIVIDNNLTIDTNVNAAVKGTLGAISIFIGTGTTTQNPSPPATIANITVNQVAGTNKAYFGANPSSITATGPMTVNLKNQSVYFNAPLTGTIQLGSGTVITADPLAFVPDSPIKTSQNVILPRGVQSTQAPAAVYPLSVASAGNAYNFANQVFLPVTDTVNVKQSFAGADASSAAQSHFLAGSIKQIDGLFDESQITVCNDCSSKVDLKYGGTVFAPRQNLSVATPFGNVHLAADSIALVVVTESGLSIYNLHDEHRGSVRLLREGGRQYSVILGEHLTVARKGKEFPELNPVPSISHADLRTFGGTAWNVYQSKFSLTSAIVGLDSLALLKNSADSSKRKLSDRLYKNAAILMQFRMPSTPYSRMSARNIDDNRKTQFVAQQN